MTIKKAIKILDWWINQKSQSMQELKQKWNYDNDKPTEIAQALIKTDETILSNLQKIIKELIPNCNHPKKMIDVCDGQKYCMDCNFDL